MHGEVCHPGPLVLVVGGRRGVQRHSVCRHDPQWPLQLEGRRDGRAVNAVLVADRQDLPFLLAAPEGVKDRARRALLFSKQLEVSAVSELTLHIVDDQLPDAVERGLVDDVDRPGEMSEMARKGPSVVHADLPGARRSDMPSSLRQLAAPAMATPPAPRVVARTWRSGPGANARRDSPTLGWWPSRLTELLGPSLRTLCRL